jgi:two-component system sensor histidine kinase RegB
MPPSALSDTRAVHRINLSWLLRLHWAAIAGQAGVIAVVQSVLHVALPIAALVAILGVEIAANAAFEAWVRSGRPVTERTLAGAMALHVTCFTGLLYFTGGPMNPFSFLYLVHIALATLILRPRWTWTLVLLSLAGSAALFVRHVPLPMDHGAHMHHMTHGGGPIDMHLRGMWVAFAIAAAFIVYFLYRVTRALGEREVELARMREHAARSERLASMATLAAGAAHELATPLATIAPLTRARARERPRLW